MFVRCLQSVCEVSAECLQSVCEADLVVHHRGAVEDRPLLSAQTTRDQAHRTAHLLPQPRGHASIADCSAASSRPSYFRFSCLSRASIAASRGRRARVTGVRRRGPADVRVTRGAGGSPRCRVAEEAVGGGAGGGGGLGGVAATFCSAVSSGASVGTACTAAARPVVRGGRRRRARGGGARARGGRAAAGAPGSCRQVSAACAGPRAWTRAAA